MGGERYTTDHVRHTGDPGKARADSAEAAESELSDRYRDRIRVFAARRLRDSAAAEDVAQETLRRVVDALREGRVEDLNALPGFVFQTARHICLQRDRSSVREARALSRWAEPDAMSEPDALVSLISEERSEAVRQALERLEHDDRALLRAIYFESIDTESVAKRMGISTGNLRVRKHRALLRLSEILRSSDR